MHNCKECGKHFDLKRYLTKHVERMHSEKRKLEDAEKTQPLKCSMCEKTFPRLSHLQRHQMTHLNVRNWACQHCDEKFGQKAHLTRHIMRKHETEYINEIGASCSKDMPYFACLNCGYLFKTTYELVAHRTSIHKPSKCGRCRKTIEGADSLRRHEMKCRNDFHVCTNCQSTFKRAADLKSHQNACLKKATFRCVPCDRLFKQRTQLDRHIMKEHFEAEKCGKCGEISESPVQKGKHWIECQERIICGYCGLENPEIGHIAERHWERLKKPVNLINRHKTKALLKKHRVTEVKNAEDGKAKEAEKNETSTQEAADSEESAEESDDFEGEEEEAASEYIAENQQASDYLEDHPDLSIFDEDVSRSCFDVHEEVLLEFPENPTSSTEIKDIDEGEEEEEREIFLSFEISPNETDLRFEFGGKLPKELVDEFPVLEQTTIVLLDGVKKGAKMMVQVPVMAKKDLERKWANKTIFI